MIRSVRRGLYDTKAPTFERASVGYSPDGSIVPPHYPRFTPGNYAMEFVEGGRVLFNNLSLDLAKGVTYEFSIYYGPKVKFGQGSIGITNNLYHHGVTGNIYFQGNNDFFSWNPENNVWYNLAMTHWEDTGNAVLYVDGNPINVTIQGTVDPINPFTSLGRMSSTFRGIVIDNFRLWNRVLDQQEVQDHIAEGPQNTEGLVAWCGFDEGSGNIAYDKSGNGNHGLIQGNTRYTDHTPIRPYGKSILIEEGTTNLVTSISSHINIPVGTSTEVNGRLVERLGENDFRLTLLEDMEGPSVLSICNTFPWDNPTTFSAHIKEYYLAPGSSGSWGIARTSTFQGFLQEVGHQSYTQTNISSGGSAGLSVRGHTNADIKAGSYIRWSNLQAEHKPYSTSFTVGTRAPERLMIPTDGIINSEEGQIDIDIDDLSVLKLTQGYLMSSTSVYASWDIERNISLYMASPTALRARLPNSGYHTMQIGPYQDGSPRRVSFAYSRDLGLRVLIDGNLVGSYPDDTEYDFSELGNYLRIGFWASPTGAYGNITVNGFRIRERAMTDQEIAEEFANGPLRPDVLTTYFLPFNGDLDTSQMVKRAPRWRGYSEVTM